MNDPKVYNRKYNDVQEQLFLRGIKPAAFHGCQKERAKTLQKLNYPYIIVISHWANNYLFFQNKEAMHEFMYKHNLNLPIMSCNHAIIGETLGYPPMAYKNFDDESEEKCIIHYHGFDFACNKQDVQECLRYMKARYEIPEELQIELSIKEPKEKKQLIK